MNDQRVARWVAGAVAVSAILLAVTFDVRLAISVMLMFAPSFGILYLLKIAFGGEPSTPKTLPCADVQLRQLASRLGRRLVWEDSVHKAWQTKIARSS